MKIQELTTWDLSDTVSKLKGYDRETLPEATADNMLIYLKKINELVDQVNYLSEKLDRN